jgi:hypothetical protein
MADEQNLQNLLVLVTPYDPRYTMLYLLPKADQETVRRHMAWPGHYTTLFSLSHLNKVEGGGKFQGVNCPIMAFIRLSERAPYLFSEGLETLIRTRWLGKAPETIQGEKEQLIEILEREARMADRTFPAPKAGEST